ncbi:hypothetical protein [Puniceicoccus vermicola]|uniref:DUF3108 domain-containing protein n=1 Tax=Puniceicoccus vermicola TaxID=388746 RepID=A0A7X1AWP3_9BACT|nr:hypothetical protein [Puniceicoccus vermicola]MBC2601373.1 hypothetical protein [Puniceicoccus vermicola]
MKIPPSLLLLSWVLSASAALADGEEISLAEAIQPRSEEARWDFSSYFFMGDQMVPGGTGREKVVEIREIEGVTIYRVEFLVDVRGFLDRLSGSPLDPDAYSYYWEYFDEEGSHNFSEDWDDPQAPVSLEDFDLTIPYPVEKGVTYSFGDADYEVIDLDRKIEVPAGTFDTVVYQMVNRYSDDPQGKDRQRYFMAPGVGLVRWEMDVVDDEGNWVLDARDDLFSYSL